MPPFGGVPVSSLGPVTAGDRGSCWDLGGWRGAPSPALVWCGCPQMWGGTATTRLCCCLCPREPFPWGLGTLGSNLSPSPLPACPGAPILTVSQPSVPCPHVLGSVSPGTEVPLLPLQPQAIGLALPCVPVLWSLSLLHQCPSSPVCACWCPHPWDIAIPHLLVHAKVLPPSFCSVRFPGLNPYGFRVPCPLPMCAGLPCPWSCVIRFLGLLPACVPCLCPPWLGVFSPLPVCAGVPILCPLQSLTLQPCSVCGFLMAQPCLHHG